jgi:general nucleoside transport system permease protein
MLRNIFNFTLIASTLRLATPLILAALGGLYCERSGVINIALEGIMLAGAFTAALVTFYSQSPWIGLLAAVAAGLLVAAIHALATINYRANQVVSGTAINILFLGVPALLCGVFFGTTGNTPQLPREQTLNDWQFFNAQSSPFLASIFNQNPLVYFALFAVLMTFFVIYRTRFGLRLRAVGENPEAADTAGVSVLRMGRTRSSRAI